ncbi:piggyBac transposable element-derived protein 4-like [Schistocerca serialis cubense]|uniref:piggyBac transposable element-derived protein 4-like n=1 Tax=Schistocerca serialis cubense TaxID=2023355 RepID=UPI00214EBDCA|nr:piggyBac transposable element-derived protein 4-like [Schistocerca serialis cubense]
MGDSLTEEEILRLLEESASEIDDDGFQTENSSSEIDGNNEWSENENEPSDVLEECEAPIQKGRGRIQQQQSQNNVVEWVNDDVLQQLPLFEGVSNVLAPLSAESTEFDCWSVFIDANVIKNIKTETNRYAAATNSKLRMQNKITSRSLWANWSAVKLHEMYQFFAIIIHMCLVHKPNITDYWSNDLMLDSSLPAKIMKRDRFRSIYFMLHVNNNDNYVRRGQPNHDPIHKIRPFFDNFVLKSKNSFSPGENLTVDEGLCPFRGRIRFRVYIKNKQSRYGIKFFILSDSATGYVLNCEVYTGAGEKDNSADSVVLRLCNSYLRKGHTLYMDRFYTSEKLFEKLFDEGTSAVGTVMRNRRGLPQEFKQNKLRRGEIVFKRKNSVLALHWKDTRDVFALSTKHRMTSSVTKTKSKAGMVEKLKPDLILDYNKNKTGVDHGDQLVTYYFQRRTMKWWKKVFFHVLMMCVVNSYILYKKLRPVSHKRTSLFTFMVNLGKQILEKSGEVFNENEKQGSAANRLTARHFPTHVPSTTSKKYASRYCIVCSEKGARSTGKRVRREARWWCEECNVGLCLPDCFKQYHTKTNFTQ